MGALWKENARRPLRSTQSPEGKETPLTRRWFRDLAGLKRRAFSSRWHNLRLVPSPAHSHTTRRSRAQGTSEGRRIRNEGNFSRPAKRKLPLTSSTELESGARSLPRREGYALRARRSSRSLALFHFRKRNSLQVAFPERSAQAGERLRLAGEVARE